MKKLERCPFCKGEVMLCQTISGYALMPEFSIVCLECGIEFKLRPTQTNANCILDPAKAANEVIDKFNRRDGEW